MKRTFLTVAAATVFAASGAYFFGGDTPAEQPFPALTGVAQAQEAAAASDEINAALAAFEADGYAVGEIVLGDPNAPVTIVEYARLSCPACGAFHRETVPALKERFIDTGVAKLIVREVFAENDAPGFTAVAIARCGGAERYHPFLDVLFQRQDDWLRVSTVEELRAKIAPIGRLGGLSPERVEQCMTDFDFMRAMLAWSTELADADNITRTPTLFVNGEEFQGAYYDIDGLSAAIEAAAQ